MVRADRALQRPEPAVPLFGGGGAQAVDLVLLGVVELELQRRLARRLAAAPVADATVPGFIPASSVRGVRDRSLEFDLGCLRGPVCWAGYRFQYSFLPALPRSVGRISYLG